MPEYKLATEPRKDTGKGPARRARAAGRVPAVLYGHGAAPAHLSVDARELGQALRAGGSNVLLSLQVGGRNRLAIAKDIQRHPVRGGFVHVDFLTVRRGERVTVPVAVHLVGDAPGVRMGGIADQELHQVEVEAEVTRVPEAIEVDVSALDIGDVLRLGDLTAPEGARLVGDPDRTVVAIAAPAVEPAPEEEVAEEEAAAAEEGAEAAAPEGEES